MAKHDLFQDQEHGGSSELSLQMSLSSQICTICFGARELIPTNSHGCRNKQERDVEESEVEGSGKVARNVGTLLLIIQLRKAPVGDH